MKIQVTTLNGYTVVEVDGRIDTVTADEFNSRLTEITGNQPVKLILDCTKLNYISSSGLRVFLMAQKRANAAGGSMKLCNLQPSIREIFDISGFSNILKLFPDLETAAS
jgi:anti-anti-sigma factor